MRRIFCLNSLVLEILGKKEMEFSCKETAAPLWFWKKKLLFPKKEANYDAGRGIYVETETVTEQKYFVLLIGLGRRGKYNLLSGVFT